MSRFTRNPNFLPVVRKAAREALHDGAIVVRDQMKALIDTEGSGRDWNTLPHTSSAAGEPPTSQSGELRDSIRESDVTAEGQSEVVHIGTDVLHARFMEAGTIHTEPRPFLRPGLAQSKEEVLAQFRGRFGTPGGAA